MATNDGDDHDSVTWIDSTFANSLSPKPASGMWGSARLQPLMLIMSVSNCSLQAPNPERQGGTRRRSTDEGVLPTESLEPRKVGVVGCKHQAVLDGDGPKVSVADQVPGQLAVPDQAENDLSVATRTTLPERRRASMSSWTLTTSARSLTFGAGIQRLPAATPAATSGIWS